MRAELERLSPGIVLIEGPPEADALVGLAADPDMEPPVALLAHVPGDPTKAAFWPFATFSPEWQALRYAAQAGIPARFCDLPAAHSLAMRSEQDDPADLEDGPAPGADPAGDEPDRDSGSSSDEQGLGSGPSGNRPGTGSGASPDGPESPGGPNPSGEAARAGFRGDPIGALAAAAGYDDPERWWEDAVEHRGDTPFEVIAEAMAAVREGYTPDEYEARREAYMRRTIRAAVKEGFTDIVVVCGAWHVPALTQASTAVADDRVLKGMPKVKAEMTWVPWTHGRLASWSGYGAGITSPGWYHHLFENPVQPIERWLTKAARVLREEGLPVSSAHVIESVRLANSLAVLRGRPLAGLAEVTEAARAVLCEGDELPVELIQRQLVVGESLGHVPDATPMVPLQRHLRDEQRRLRLKPEALSRDYDLDLRKPLDLDRSKLLHRLRVLGVPWGVPRETRGKGTFKESWTLEWHPEYDITLIEAAACGVTVPAAATTKIQEVAGPADTRSPGLPGAPTGEAGSVSLADLTGLVEQCLLADLPDALPHVLTAIGDRAALDHDVRHLMSALPALVRAQRYGDVRGTPAEGLGSIVTSLLARSCAGLSPAVTGLDDDTAREMVAQIDAVTTAVTLLDDPPPDPIPGATAGTSADSGAGPDVGASRGLGAGAEHAAREAATAEPVPGTVPEPATGSAVQSASEYDAASVGEYVSAVTPKSRWLAALRGVADRADAPGVIEGRVVRILFDAEIIDDADDRMARAMSLGHPPVRVAAWIEGFLSGGGLMLVHDARLLAMVDGWLTGLRGDAFVDVLPLLRRTFGAFAPPERRAIGSRVAAGATVPTEITYDAGQAAGAVQTVLAILGRA
ncbi:DUF5682 family protein [Acrocarpospora phusangensis]|uniref:DUF5682 family protein n=1 Tax=Acrocarpospora phusangensis TaxID=1070424 RepID=UPI001EF34609|nr:DUF5682 family protein [Acrocarpospora phusangensis]